MRSEHEPQRTPLGPVALADWQQYEAANERAINAYRDETHCKHCGAIVPTYPTLRRRGRQCDECVGRREST